MLYSGRDNYYGINPSVQSFLVDLLILPIWSKTELRLLCISNSLWRHSHPQPFISFTVRMITAKPVFVARHSLRRGIANPQLLRKSSEHRAQHDICFGVSQWHPNTLSRAAPKGYHIVVESLRLLGALQPAFWVEFHRVWKDFWVAVHHP
jgi:hypothetical protein